MNIGFSNEVITLLLGLGLGIIVGIAISIVFSGFVARIFGPRKVRKLQNEIKGLKMRIRKKDQLIEKGVQELADEQKSETEVQEPSGERG